MGESIRGFVAKRPTTFQAHQHRIETLLTEGMYDGKAWKPEAFDRYSELEDQEAEAVVQPELRPLPEAIELYLHSHLSGEDATRAAFAVHAAIVGWNELQDRADQIKF